MPLMGGNVLKMACSVLGAWDLDPLPRRMTAFYTSFFTQQNFDLFNQLPIQERSIHGKNQ
jgi:hypothetical protein